MGATLIRIVKVSLFVAIKIVPLDLGWGAVPGNVMFTLIAQVENAMLNTINAV